MDNNSSANDHYELAQISLMGLHQLALLNRLPIQKNELDEDESGE